MRKLEEHRGILASVANAYCRDRAAREDVMQSIAAELWRVYPRYDGRARFSTWMYRIAVNMAISYYRRERRHLRSVTDYDQERLESLPAEPAEDEDEQRTALHQLIDGLDDLHRALLVLYLDGNSYAQIADVLGISETNVATKLSRVKERLRRNAMGGSLSA